MVPPEAMTAVDPGRDVTSELLSRRQITTGRFGWAVLGAPKWLEKNTLPYVKGREPRYVLKKNAKGEPVAVQVPFVHDFETRFFRSSRATRGGKRALRRALREARGVRLGIDRDYP
jgi:hypothetical protein